MRRRHKKNTVRERTERTKQRSLIRSALINGMCIFGAWRRKAPTAPSVELASHTRLLATIVTCANCLLFALVLLFSFTQKTALSSYISYYRSLVFCVWKPCGCSTSDCDVLLRSSHTKRSGISREMSLSMRVPSVAPCGAVPWVPSN